MKPLSNYLTIAIILISSITVSAQDIRFTPKDKEICEKALSFAADKANLPTSELVTSIALHFLGTPYVAGTLEIEPEMLTINLRETDCILFVEMCTALALTAKGIDLASIRTSSSDPSKNASEVVRATPSFSLYCNNVLNLRYRNGVVDGYASRIHYTSEWILQNSKYGIMKEMSRRYGEKIDQKFSYMSTHPASYKQLNGSPNLVKLIAESEKAIESKGPFFYIRQSGIELNANNIKNGDIIGFVTRLEGIDISHVAFAYWNGGKLHFIHASQKEGKVVIDKKTLSEYAKNGIRLIQLL